MTDEQTATPKPAEKMSGGKALLWIVAAVLLVAGVAGVSSHDSSGADSRSDVADVESIVSHGYGDKKAIIVRSTTCSSDDALHFSCAVTYEGAEGVTYTATVAATCDSSKCVWREQ